VRHTVRRYVRFAAIWLAAISALWGCSGEPSGPSSDLDDYYVAAVYRYCPAGDPTGIGKGAFVWVRDGSSTGPCVDGLSVAFNGVPLEYIYGEYYWNRVAVVPGDRGTFTISTGGCTGASQAETVPYAPFLPAVGGGHWDASQWAATNVISWKNPATVGDKIHVRLYDWDGASAQLLYQGYVDDPHSTSCEIPNQQLSYLLGIDAIRCVVYQCNFDSFNGQLSGSYAMIMSGVWVDWPVIGPGEKQLTFPRRAGPPA
jgi:hypothetical protein